MKFRISTIPRKWETVEASSHLKAVESSLDNFWLYDSDNSGEDNYTFAVIDENKVAKYFLVHQEWYWDWDLDNESRSPDYLANEFTIKEITKEEAWLPGDRDWLNV